MRDPVSAPSVVPVQPDVEAWVWSLLSSIGGTTSWIDASFIEWPPWQVRYEFQIDSRARDRVTARARAMTAYYIVLGLPDEPWPEGIVTYVQPTIGPSWFPDPDGAPRYTARYEVRVHPTDLIPAP
jgi:hypothetical protein